MIASVITFVAWNAVYETKHDNFSTAILVYCTAIIIHGTYTNEYNYKQNLLQLERIKTMNEELQSLLMSLPEGIVLLDTNSKTVSLANNQFKKLFSLPEECSTEMINDKLEDEVLRLHSKAK
jgi:sensor histidine kinase regulating citrate/malate metabolism